MRNVDPFEWDWLKEALVVGFEHDPTPIVGMDYWDIIKEDFPTLRAEHCYAALEELVREGKVKSEMMQDKRTDAPMTHFYGVEWDGKL